MTSKSRIESGEAWVGHAHFGGMVITSLGTLLMFMVTTIYIKKNSELHKMKNAGKSLLAPALFLSVITCILGAILTYFIFISKNI